MDTVSGASRAHVKEYRALFLDQEGHVFRALGFDGMDDEEAMQRQRASSTATMSRSGNLRERPE
jgi:hypothetical protein